MWTIFFSIGSLLSAIAVGLGAFGAHALRGRLTPEDFGIFETASRYLGLQSIGIIGFSLLMLRLDSLPLKIGALALTAGAIIFSGSLYILIFTGTRAWGAVTPVGGLLLIVGWLLGSWSAFSANWQ
jgi:uncharacterized membrane protein YgdD (TMEM256/DUF423 family)